MLKKYILILAISFIQCNSNHQNKNNLINNPTFPDTTTQITPPDTSKQISTPNSNKNPIIGSWLISSFRLNSVIRNINDYPNVINKITFKDDSTGLLTFVDYGIIRTNQPNNITYKYYQRPEGEKVLEFTILPDNITWWTICYINSNELTLMYTAGYFIECIYTRL